MKKLLTMLLCFVLAASCAFGVAACTPDDAKDDTGIVTPGGDEETPSGDEETPGGNEETPGGDEETPGGDEETPGGDEEPEPELPASEGLSFALNNDGASYAVTGIGTCTDTDVVIPSQYNGLPVTSIGYEAFYFCGRLTSVIIPDSVTTIGDGAFYNTAYYNDESNWENDVLYIGQYLIAAKDSISGEYTIKAGTTVIADDAFSYCDLTSIVIPDSVTSIGMRAFSGCRSLASITVDLNNSVYHSSGNCLIETDSKTLIAGCNTSVIPVDGSVTSIGGWAFDGCTSLEIGRASCRERV